MKVELLKVVVIKRSYWELSWMPICIFFAITFKKAQEGKVSSKEKYGFLALSSDLSPFFLFFSPELLFILQKTIDLFMRTENELFQPHQKTSAVKSACLRYFSIVLKGHYDQGNF